MKPLTKFLRNQDNLTRKKESRPGAGVVSCSQRKRDEIMEDPVEHIDQGSRTEPGTLHDQNYYRALQEQYAALMHHHHQLLAQYQALQNHHRHVLERYQTLQYALVQDRDQALRDYHQALQEHHRMVQDYHDELQEHHRMLQAHLQRQATPEQQ